MFLAQKIEFPLKETDPSNFTVPNRTFGIGVRRAEGGWQQEERNVSVPVLYTSNGRGGRDYPVSR